MSDEYERYVTRNIVQLVETLRPSLLLEHSVASNLVTMQEARKLRQCSTEQDSARMLLYDILPYKENAVDRFCEVLKRADQSHIARDVMKRGGVVCTDECASNLQTGRQHITREVMGKEDVVESAKCSIKVGVSGQKGSSQRFVSSPCRPSCTRCESERKEGTAARDLVVKTAVCSRKVNASVCRWWEEESVRSTDFSRHDDCKESAALDVCGERKTESLAEQVESEDEEETLSCLDAEVTTSRDPVETSGGSEEPPTVTTDVTSEAAVVCAHASSSLTSEDESWPAIRRNHAFLLQHLRFSQEFLCRLYEQRFISKDEFGSLRRSSLTQEANKHRLLVDILPSKPMSMFPAFCNILHSVGQSDVAVKLEENVVHDNRLLQETRRQRNRSLSEKVETLTAQVARLEREKTAACKQTEEERKRSHAEKLRADAGDWTNLAFRCDKAQDVKRMKINDSLPSWTQWNVHVPHDRWWYSYNRMGEIEGRLVVGGRDGNLHVLTYEHDKWDKFVRKNGDIWNVVCHQGVCLVCVKDGDKDQFVIEQFHLNEDKKWRFLTVLPNELQLDCVSVALHDNSLYVVGGRTKSEERVNTARVCDLHSGHWYKMDDMQTKRSYCSSVIINNTVFVGGGVTDGRYSSNIVECADVRDRKWRTIPSTTTYWPTLTSVSNRLVGTGGWTQQWMYSPSNIVELYDERSTKWLSLPLMTHKRWGHAAFSTQNGELITAGGDDGGHSIESLN
ncbi:uncharacterized protein LOC134198093 isoform X3 [Corticium candelabrum]|uniref:uncharacterized protein LOC134198093 isoform X3 n=1 Tax=Corticium candelabrum TaxID=121492 RepID=UPI002E25A1AE|nr:uncharacterized protein LOC134198093 isoform X3 [Corticium candelabrum]